MPEDMPQHEEWESAETELVLAAKKGDWQARDRLYMALAPRVWWMADKNARRWGIDDPGLTYDRERFMIEGHAVRRLSQADLYSAGIGRLAETLDRQLEKFDPERGFSFWTFIYRSLHGAMVTEYRMGLGVVKCPDAVRRLYRPVRRAIEDLATNQKDRACITAEDVQAKLVAEGHEDVTVQNVRDCMQVYGREVSMSAPIGEEDEETARTLEDTLPGETPDLEQYERREMLKFAQFCCEQRPACLGLGGEEGAQEIAVLVSRVVWENGDLQGERSYEEVCKQLNSRYPSKRQFTVENARQKSSRCTRRLVLGESILLDTNVEPEELVERYSRHPPLRKLLELPRVELTPKAVRGLRDDYAKWSRDHRGWNLDNWCPAV